MSAVADVLSTLLYVYLLILFVRLAAEWIQVFAREWQPRGVVLVALEAVYTVTDPPLRFIRRLVPPLRLGSFALDLAFIILFIGISIALSVVRSVG